MLVVEDDESDDAEDEEEESEVLPDAAGFDAVAGVLPLLFPFRA